jgi:hypothetical protein
VRAFCAVAAVALIAVSTAEAKTIRVAVTSLGDPSIERSLYPTAAELCPRARQVAPRRWRLTCRDPRHVAEELGARAVDGRTVLVETPFVWRRFPLSLQTKVVHVSRFRSINAGPRRIEVSRPGLTLSFVRMEAHAAAQAFRRGELDAAPVALGDLKAALADSVVGPRVHVRPIRALDVVRFDPRRGALAGLPNTRRAYWQSADRLDYEALVPEHAAGRAWGLVPGAPAPPPLRLRPFRRHVRTLPPVAVRLAARGDDLGYGADLLAANWREVGLGPRVVGDAPDTFERLRAAYDAPEAIFFALGPSPSPLFRRALAAPDPLPALRRLDAQLRRSAEIVPVSWVASAWLVSPRLKGWRQDRLGVVDYSRFG